MQVITLLRVDVSHQNADGFPRRRENIKTRGVNRYDTGYQGIVVATRVVEIQPMAIRAEIQRLSNTTGYGTCIEREAVGGIKGRARTAHTSQSDLVEKGKLLNVPDCRHIRVIVCGLQMRHWFKHVNAGYVLRPQHLLFQVRGHEERAL